MAEQQKKWFKKTEVIIGLFGIIFPIIASLLISKFNDNKKELTITYSPFEAIITESDILRGNLKISYDSTEILNVSKLTLKIKNTGNTSLVKSDFIDGPINFNIKYLSNKGSSILQVSKKDDAKQQNSELTYFNSVSASSIKYMPSLLNKNDEVVIEAYFLNIPTTNISVLGKLLNGNIVGPKPIEANEVKIGYKTFILSINSFFRYSWLTIFVMMVLFVLSALSSIFQFVMADDKEHRRIGIIRAFAVTTTIIAIMAIIIVISVLIYV